MSKVSAGAFGLLMAVAGLELGSSVARASATTIYIAQTAAGSANGSSCANAYAVTFFNTSSNWGSGASQIGPGTVVNLCGTLTTGLQINGSGASGNVISVVWTTGSRISVPYGQIINLNGSYGYLLFDGGIACGPGSSCDTIEAANPAGYASGQAGIIEATANGSALASKSTNTQAFYGCNGATILRSATSSSEICTCTRAPQTAQVPQTRETSLSSARMATQVARLAPSPFTTARFMTMETLLVCKGQVPSRSTSTT